MRAGGGMARAADGPHPCRPPPPPLPHGTRPLPPDSHCADVPPLRPGLVRRVVSPGAMTRAPMSTRAHALPRTDWTAAADRALLGQRCGVTVPATHV